MANEKPEQKKEEDDGFGLEEVTGGLIGGAAGSFLGPVGTVAGAKIGSDSADWVHDRLDDAGSWLQDNAGSLADGALKFVNPIGGALFEKVTDGGFSALQEKAKAAEERKGNIDKAKQALEGGGQGKTSDEHLDQGKIGLDFFKEFLPLYKDWTGGKGADFQNDIVKPYDELREIDFGAFREDAQRLSGVQKSLLDTNDQMGQSFRTAQQTWTGSAAESAGNKVAQFSQSGTTVTNETENFAGAITPAIDGIEKTVKDYAKFVLELGKEIKCAGKDPDDTKDEIRKARGDLGLEDLKDVGIDDIFSGMWSVIKDQAIGIILGGPIGGMIGQFIGAKDACDQIRQGVIDDAKKWLDESFKPEMEQKTKSFTDQTKATQDAIGQAYDQMLQAAKISDDPFKGLDGQGKDSGSDDSGNKQPSGNQPSGNSDTGGGGTGGGGTGGGGTGGGGTGGGGTGGAQPEMPKTPETPEMPKSPEMPGQEGGKPGQEESVTLGEGKDAVTVGKPGQDGKMDVELVGPDGKPKTYEVDFGQQGGQPGAISAPGAPGQPGTQSMPAAGDMPAAAGQPGTGGAQAVQAGPDGKAVIHEGDRTLTFERTPEGEVKVSVDEGKGEPTKQTIDFGNDPSPMGATGVDGTGSAIGSPGMGGAESGSISEPVGGGITGGIPGSEPLGPSSPGNEPVGGGITGGMPGAEPSGPSFSPGNEPVGGGFAGVPGAGQSGVDPGFGAGNGPVGGGFAGGGQPVADPGFSSGTVGSEAVGSPAATSAQSAGGGFTASGEGVSNSFGSAAGSLFGGDQHDQAGQQNTGQTGLSSFGDPQGNQSSGQTGLSSLGDPTGGSGQSGQTANQNSAMGGGMMGGMMGGMHGGGQQGGEQERTNDSPWRTQGQLFDDGIDPSAGNRFRAVLGEDREK